MNPTHPTAGEREAAPLVRSPADIIKAILANLQYAHDVAHRAAQEDEFEYKRLRGEAAAYRQAIALVQVEAASLLTVTP